MTATNVNIPLLRKAVEWAEAEAAKPPELCEWEQKWWVISPRTRDDYAASLRSDRAPECGTTYCIAGYICEVVLGRDGANEGGWADIAADALGIEYDACDGDSPAARLFNATNTTEMVRSVAESLAGERL